MIGSIDVLANISIRAVASIAMTGRRSLIAAQVLSADLRKAASRGASPRSSRMNTEVARNARKIAPPETGRNGTPGGAFEVYPPTVYWTVGGTCNQQVLITVRGYRLAPGKEARVWFLVQAGRPGTFHVRGDVVRYRQHGVNYQQFIPTGYQGSVAAHAPFVPIDPLEKRCLKSMKNARLLPGHYLTKPKHGCETRL